MTVTNHHVSRITLGVAGCAFALLTACGASVEQGIPHAFGGSAATGFVPIAAAGSNDATPAVARPSDVANGAVATPSGVAGSTAAPPDGMMVSPAPPSSSVTTPDVYAAAAPPLEGDGRLADGSLERSAGAGWDTCYTRTPGLSVGTDGAADGTRFLAFDSTQQGFPVDPDGALTQIAFWFDEPLEPSGTYALWFDIRALTDGVPSGTLHVDDLGLGWADPPCSSVGSLATLDLASLEVEQQWQPRCATLQVTAPTDHIGLYVTGLSFRIGIDSLRLGGECPAPAAAVTP